MERLTDAVYAQWASCQQESDSRKLLQFRVLRLGLLQDGDVGVGVFLSEGVLTGSRQPSIGCNHDLSLAQKIQVSVAVDGMRIDDGGEVT